MEKRKTKVFLLLCIVIALIAFGMLMIYCASSYSAQQNYGDSFYFVKKQLFGFALGVVLFLLTYRLDYHVYKKFRWAIVIVSVVLLVLVFVPVIGVSNNGARRWISVAGISLQSSEVAKFGYVIFLSAYISMHKEKLKSFKGLLVPLAVGGVICGLVLLEPNLSVTLCIGMVMVLMLVIGGISLKHFIILCIPALCLLPVLIIVEPYRLQRLMAFINPWASPKDEGFQLIQSLYSLGSGGLFGVGLFNSRQKYLYLPFSESDFIFSIIGEEFGLVGCMIVILFYVLLVRECIKIAYRANDRFGSYLSFGIGIVIAVQTLINVAVVTGSIPPTGIPLPFISAGGTSLSVFMAMIGILCNVAKNRNEKQINVFCFHKESKKPIK